MNHSFENKIEEILNKIRIRFSSQKDSEINDAIQIIKDEKLRYHNPENAIVKALKLKEILKDKNISCPPEIDYIIASIHFENKKDYDKAIDIYSNILNNPKASINLKNRTKFMMCKAILNKSYDLDIEKISKYIEELSDYISQNNDYRDDYVIGGLYELKQKKENWQKDLSSTKDFTIYSHNTTGISDQINFFTEKDALDFALEKDSDIIINLVNNTVYIHKNLKNFSDNEIEILYSFYQNLKSQDIINNLGIEKDNFYQIVKRLRTKLKNFGINTVPRQYKFDSNVKVIIIENNLDSDNY